ncbi:MAG TPA: hypothetical protein VJ850_06410 [Candidatus Limnocylindrales bacterium]|nr:hypothetical protein [Candidatus Limnocylindrales bacterium]
MPERTWPTDPREFILAYLDAWNQADVERVIDAFHVPSLIHTDGDVIQHLTPESRLDFLGAYVDSTRDALAAGGRWTCPELAILELGRDAALATAQWVFTSVHGQVTEDYFDSYLLTLIGGRWYVLVDAIHRAG